MGGGGGSGCIWGGGGGVGLLRGQGGCEQRIKVFVKIQKKNGGGLGGGSGGFGGVGSRLGGSGWGGQGGCERRIEVFVKTQKKLDLMFMKHYAPNRCLYIKVAKISTGGECRDKIAVSNYSKSTSKAKSAKGDYSKKIK